MAALPWVFSHLESYTQYYSVYSSVLPDPELACTRLSEIRTNILQRFIWLYASLHIITQKLSLIYVHTHCSFALQLLESRMSRGQDELGEEKFLLDGFPRTASQAELLVESTDVRLAVNMHLREDVSLRRLICYSAAVLHHLLFGVQNIYAFGPILSLQLCFEFCGDAVELVFVQGGKECESNLRRTVFENPLQSVLLQHPWNMQPALLSQK